MIWILQRYKWFPVSTNLFARQKTDIINVKLLTELSNICIRLVVYVVDKKDRQWLIQ